MSNKNSINLQFISGFAGYIINIINLKNMYKLYIETGSMKQLPTYQLSQDSLECLFSRIRSLNGNCENPPVTMFTSAIRKILIHNEITSSRHANCADNLKILTVSNSRGRRNNIPKFTVEIDSQMQEEENEHLQTLVLNENDFIMDCTEEATIASIAGSIEEKVRKAGRFECECISVLLRNEKVSGLTISDNLIPPCVSSLHVCKIANIYFELCRNHITFDYNAMIEKIIISIDFDQMFTQFFVCDSSHKEGFLKYIVEEYIRAKANYVAKNVTLVEQKILCRKVLQKRVHFRGQ